MPGMEAIGEILAGRIDRQKQAVGIAAGVIDSAGRRVIRHGSQARDGLRPVGADTIFEIGSLTKVFTSLALAEMVTRHEVALDDPVALYLPEQVRMPERNGRAITLRDLSWHASGLPRLPGNLKPKDPANPYAGYTAADMYEFLSGYELTRDPGAEVEYSNLGAGLLGHVLARRAGTDYEGLIRSRITGPLGMPDTTIALTPPMKERLATGHNAALEPVSYWDVPTLEGAGALRSTAHDMLTLLEAFLGYRESTLAPAMEMMLRIRRMVGQTRFEVGLGWSVLGDMAWHDGGTGGFRSCAGFDRKTRTGVVVLSNAFTAGGVDDIGIHILNPNTPLKEPEPAQHRVEAGLLDRYTGRYQLTPDRVFAVTRVDGRLFLQTFAPGIVGPLFETAANDDGSFTVPMTGSKVSFECGPGGLATTLIAHRTGREPMRAPRLP